MPLMATWGPTDIHMWPLRLPAALGTRRHTYVRVASGTRRDTYGGPSGYGRLRGPAAMGKVWQHLGLLPLLSGAAVTSDYKSDLCSLLLPPEAQALLLQPDKAKVKVGNS